MGIKLKIHIKHIFYVAVASIIVLELMLFLSGQYLLWHRRMSSNGPGAIPVVCVGDSHTFGVGTSMLYSYPAQLEQLLRLNNEAHKFSVVNLGVPGASTRRQSQELADYLKTHQAKIVILLTGRNNNLEIEQKMDKSDPSISQGLRYQLLNSRVFRLLKLVFERIFHRGQEHSAAGDYGYGERDTEYLNTYLLAIRALCLERGAKLVLLSYYNSSNKAVKNFALKYHIPYYDLTGDFYFLFKAKTEARYISPDRSHMNRLGYKFFAEQLYRHLFIDQGYLGIKINPLLRRKNEDDFYSDPLEKERMIKLQEKRVEQSRDSGEYPFELIHLGHIYSETGDDGLAKEYYGRALLASNYADNNTIVSPIIDWHLKRGQKSEALAICEEILRHNPANHIAARYRSWLLADPQHPDAK